MDIVSYNTVMKGYGSAKYRSQCFECMMLGFRFRRRAVVMFFGSRKCWSFDDVVETWI